MIYFFLLLKLNAPYFNFKMYPKPFIKKYNNFTTYGLLSKLAKKHMKESVKQ